MRAKRGNRDAQRARRSAAVSRLAMTWLRRASVSSGQTCDVDRRLRDFNVSGAESCNFATFDGRAGSAWARGGSPSRRAKPAMSTGAPAISTPWSARLCNDRRERRQGQFALRPRRALISPTETPQFKGTTIGSSRRAFAAASCASSDPLRLTAGAMTAMQPDKSPASFTIRTKFVGAAKYRQEYQCLEYDSCIFA